MQEPTNKKTLITLLGATIRNVRCCCPSGCADSFRCSRSRQQEISVLQRKMKTVRAPAWADSFAAIAKNCAFCVVSRRVTQQRKKIVHTLLRCVVLCSCFSKLDCSVNVQQKELPGCLFWTFGASMTLLVFMLTLHFTRCC